MPSSCAARKSNELEATRRNFQGGKDLTREVKTKRRKPDREARTCGSQGRPARTRRTIALAVDLNLGKEQKRKDRTILRSEKKRNIDNENRMVITCLPGKLQTAEVSQAALI